ncbi:MAG: tetratricopeptide repeat protein [Terriglobales bacterium]
MRFSWLVWVMVGLLVVPLLAFAQAGDAASLLAEGDRSLVADHFDAARNAYTAALNAGADLAHDALHSRNLGRCYLSAAKPDYAQAVRWLEQSVRIETSDDARRMLARAQTGMGDYEAAAESYRLLSLSHPQEPDYILGCARSLRQAGKTDGALDYLRDTLERAPSLTSVRVEYGRLLSFQRQLPEAKRQFELVLAADPQNLGAQLGLAKVTSWQGDQQSALRLYERIFERNPGLYDALVGKAFSLLWTGRVEQARPLLLEAAHRHPDDQDVREALHSIGSPVPELPAAAASAERPSRKPGSTDKSPVKLAAKAPERPSPKRSPTISRPRYATRDLLPHADPPSRQKSLVRRILDPLLSPISLRFAWYLASAGGVLLLIVVLAGVIPWPARASRPLPKPYTGLPRPKRAARASVEKPAAPEPAMTAASASTPPASAEVASPKEVSSALSGNTVTLVGNNDAVLQLQARVLSAAGANVSGFDSWNAAWNFLDGTAPGLLVLNPLTADGWTALTIFAWLTANRPDLVARTLVTMSVMDEAGEQFCRSRGASFLYHPFGAGEFLAAAVAIAEPRVTQPPPAPAAELSSAAG